MKYRKYIASIAVLLMATAACTDKMDGLNVDKKWLSNDDAQIDYAEGGILIPGMLNKIVLTTTGLQTGQNLLADSYAGYLEPPTPFRNNSNTQTYDMVANWMNAAYKGSTDGVMNPWLEMKNLGFDQKYPDLYAIALIIKVFAAHRLVDNFGPYPYTGYGTGNDVQFDSEEVAYDAFFKELDEAVTVLKETEANDPNTDKIRFARWDVSSLGGEYTNWIKLANTLRLRLALRISYVNPQKAKIEAEKAVKAENLGVLSDLSFSVTPVGSNPYYTFNFNWTDSRLSASVETYLKGFNDPRLPAYALPAEDASVSGQIKGIRPGVEKPNKDLYLKFSAMNVQITSPVKIMDGAESYFLLAEGKLKGWNMNTSKTVQQLYEDGIKSSFKLNGVSGADAYLLSTGTQAPYVDPKNHDNDSPALTDITPKWDDAASDEKKLERIITQKWITVFPEGVEGWSEFRRTGYPKLYPVKVSKNPDLPLGTFIKRYIYGPVVTTTNPEAVNKAVADYLNGRNSAAERIWWDVR